jgi:NIMA (never in mitosis gene a)-related kinase
MKEMLGRGSFGSVYRAVRRATKRTYVVKQINVQLLSEEEQRDAVKEVRLMASLSHPHVVHYFDSFIDGSLLNIVMGLCDGGDLQNFLQHRGRSGGSKTKLSEPLVWHLFVQTCLGMAYMHAKRILHRDLKTANIFLSKTDDPSRPHVKIGDLGVARVLDSSSSFAQTMVGTPYYLSPELCEDKPYNNKSDVWALGCVLYEMCSLTHPFEANNQGALILKIVRGKYPPLHSNEYSGALRHLVACLLSRSPMRRPTVQQVLDLLAVKSWARKLGLDLPRVTKEEREEVAVVAEAAEDRRNRQDRREKGARVTMRASTKTADVDEREGKQREMMTERTERTERKSEKQATSSAGAAPEAVAATSDATLQRFSRQRVPIRNVGGNVRGTRVRSRRSRRVISATSSTNRSSLARVSLHRTQLERTQELVERTPLERTQLGASVKRETRETREMTETRRIPPGLAVRARPTLAQLHARMSSRAMSHENPVGETSSHVVVEDREERV